MKSVSQIRQMNNLQSMICLTQSLSNQLFPLVTIIILFVIDKIKRVYDLSPIISPLLPD